MKHGGDRKSNQEVKSPLDVSRKDAARTVGVSADVAKLRQGYRRDYATDMQNCISVKTRDEVAKAIDVSKRTIASAAHIKKHGTKELLHARTVPLFKI